MFLMFMGPCIVTIFPYISNKMQRYTVYFIWKLLYMFRVVPPPIIMSANNCIYSIWYLSHHYCYLPLSRKSWKWFECAVGTHSTLKPFPNFKWTKTLTTPDYTITYIGHWFLAFNCTDLNSQKRRNWRKQGAEVVKESQGSKIHIMIRLRFGRSGVQIPVQARDFSST